ncbi:hypothetical protein CTEN210_18435 [Chaetoceros tenuissimus]|uniref:RING-type E3 ubiquitin transferase n=1 Tax=Chaetoceros tenuissimus TaxID=426638 RepID=A0AAD3DCI9_9STRA|nr:hypothetical protein CTEN210_18435 [Chaetoceros tenuissimus]
MNASDRKSETCTSGSGCATSFDKSWSKEKKQSAENIANNIRGASALVNITESKGQWSYSEHCTFLDGLYAYGKDWEKIAALVKSRNAEEVWCHFDSFQKQEPFIFTLRRMLEDKSLGYVIGWQTDGQTFCIYDTLKFVRVALLLYFGGSFHGFGHFETELYSYGFNQIPGNGAWFHSDFWRGSTLELKRQDLKQNVCNRKLCKKTSNLMKCSGCYNVCYCSLACQQSDWHFHQWACGKKETCNDKSLSTDTGTNASNNTHDRNTKVISEVKASATSETQKPLKGDKIMNTGAWTTIEHRLFLEALEKYGRSRQDIAYHVKTRTARQVDGHSQKYLKRVDCYWTTKEHQLFLEGLEKYDRGRWVEIASHVGTKNQNQASFHAKEYFKEMNKESQERDSREGDSLAARKFVNRPDTKRSRDEEITPSESSKKIKTNDEQNIVTPDKDTRRNTANVINSSLELSRQKTTGPQNGHTSKSMGVSTDEIPDKSSQSKMKTRAATKTAKPLKGDTNTNKGKSLSEEELRGQALQSRVCNNSLCKETDNLRQCTGCHNAYYCSLACQQSDWVCHKLACGKKGTCNDKPLSTDTGTNASNNTHDRNTTTNCIEGSSLPVREIVNRPDTKRSRDEEITLSEGSKKIKTNEPSRQKNDESNIINQEKDTRRNTENVIVNTNSLESSRQKTTGPQNGYEPTCDDYNHENEMRSPSCPAKENNVLHPVGHKAKMPRTDPITTDVQHEISCPICLEKLNDPHIVPECCHRFCKGCIERALKHRNECPKCRCRVTSRRALRRDEVFGELLCLFDIEKAKDGKGIKFLEAQLQKKETRINTLEIMVRTLSDEHKSKSMAASAQLEEKNSTIQHFESRQK